MHIEINTIDTGDYNIIYFEREILMKINVIHYFICNFHNTEGNLQYGHAINANGQWLIPMNYPIS